MFKRFLTLDAVPVLYKVQYLVQDEAPLDKIKTTHDGEGVLIVDLPGPGSGGIKWYNGVQAVNWP